MDDLPEPENKGFTVYGITGCNACVKLIDDLIKKKLQCVYYDCCKYKNVLDFNKYHRNLAEITNNIIFPMIFFDGKLIENKDVKMYIDKLICFDENINF